MSKKQSSRYTAAERKAEKEIDTFLRSLGDTRFDIMRELRELGLK